MTAKPRRQKPRQKKARSKPVATGVVVPSRWGVSWNDEAICRVCERQMDRDEIIPLDIGGVAHGRCYANAMIYFYPWGATERLEQLLRRATRKIGGLKSK